VLLHLRCRQPRPLWHCRCAGDLGDPLPAASRPPALQRVHAPTFVPKEPKAAVTTAAAAAASAAASASMPIATSTGTSMAAAGGSGEERPSQASAATDGASGEAGVATSQASVGTSAGSSGVGDDAAAGPAPAGRQDDVPTPAPPPPGAVHQLTARKRITATLVSAVPAPSDAASESAGGGSGGAARGALELMRSGGDSATAGLTSSTPGSFTDPVAPLPNLMTVAAMASPPRSAARDAAVGTAASPAKPAAAQPPRKRIAPVLLASSLEAAGHGASASPAPGDPDGTSLGVGVKAKRGERDGADSAGGVEEGTGSAKRARREEDSGGGGGGIGAGGDGGTGGGV